MRLLELEFTALGPYPDRQMIDFTRFEANGLYLLRGQTGSGKSTIIDAITFALYGMVAGGSDSTSLRLRSHYANPATRTSVRLRFQTWGQIYEVIRTPAYSRPGFKSKTAATATLQRLQPTRENDRDTYTYESLATGSTAVSRAVEEITGVNFAQFCQTVILPQGKFAHFLGASADQRRQILASIFHTSQYERFIEEIKDRADAKQTEVRVETTRATEKGLTLHQSVHALAMESAWDQALKVAEEFCADLDMKLKAARERVSQIESHRLEADLSLNESVRIEQHNQDYARVTAQLKELENKRDEYEARQRQLQLAQSALPIIALTGALEKAEHALEQATTDYEQARSQAVASELNLPDQMLTDKRDEITLQLQRLDDALQAEREFAQQQDAHRRGEAKLTKINARIAANDSRISEGERALPGFEAHLAQLAQGVEKLPGLLQEKESLVERLGYISQADKLREELVECAEQIGSAKRKQAQTMAELVSVRQSWISSSAARLAQQLEAGCPCPVCGSDTHPQPAQSDAMTVSDEALEAAQVAYEEANQLLTALQQRQGKLNDQIASLNAQAKADKPTLELRLEDLSQQISNCQRQVTQLGQSQDDLAAAKAELEKLRGDTAQLRIEAASLSERQRSVEKELHRLASVVEGARGNFDSIADRHQEMQSQLQLVMNLMRALEALTHATKRQAEAKEQVDQSLSESPFADLDTAKAAHLSPAARKDIEAEIRSWLNQLSGCQTLRDKLKATGLIGRVHPDLTVMKQRSRDLSMRAKELNGEVSRFEQQQHDAQRTFTGFEASVKHLRKLQQELAPLQQLARVARGATGVEGDRVRLDAWILSHQFREVVAAANPYLDRFSSGRYQLERVQHDPGTVKTQAGLGLAIVDGQTDEKRAPSSLSGGETFYTSLALALGLVEVISSYRGGIEFQSMIIDEGFGHLDALTLSDVMTGLEKLRDSGRTVGVVSHVEQMRERIKDGIEVHQNDQGHSRLVVRGS